MRSLCASKYVTAASGVSLTRTSKKKKVRSVIRGVITIAAAHVLLYVRTKGPFKDPGDEKFWFPAIHFC
jgi:VIT1/CCC1 family predicted Fe2+/Mn2+ transporter